MISIRLGPAFSAVAASALSMSSARAKAGTDREGDLKNLIIYVHYRSVIKWGHTVLIFETEQVLKRWQPPEKSN